MQFKLTTISLFSMYGQIYQNISQKQQNNLT